MHNKKNLIILAIICYKIVVSAILQFSYKLKSTTPFCMRYNIDQHTPPSIITAYSNSKCVYTNSMVYNLYG